MLCWSQYLFASVVSWGDPMEFCGKIQAHEQNVQKSALGSSCSHAFYPSNYFKVQHLDCSFIVEGILISTSRVLDHQGALNCCLPHLRSDLFRFQPARAFGTVAALGSQYLNKKKHKTREYSLKTSQNHHLLRLLIWSYMMHICRLNIWKRAVNVWWGVSMLPKTDVLM